MSIYLSLYKISPFVIQKKCLMETFLFIIHLGY